MHVHCKPWRLVSTKSQIIELGRPLDTPGPLAKEVPAGHRAEAEKIREVETISNRSSPVPACQEEKLVKKN